MKRKKAGGIIIIFILAGVAVAVPSAEDPAAWKGLTPEQIERVKKGEIVILDQDTSESKEEQKRFIQAAMIFDQPIEKVWEMFKRTELQDRYLPDLDRCELVHRDEKGDLVDFHVKLVIEINYRINHHYDNENFHLWWHLDPNYKNDMKRVDGFWKLYQLDEKRTLARYGTRVEVSSLIPEFIMVKLTQTNLPANMEAVYKYIQSGGVYTKPGFKEK